MVTMIYPSRRRTEISVRAGFEFHVDHRCSLYCLKDDRDELVRMMLESKGNLEARNNVQTLSGISRLRSIHVYFYCVPSCF